ncbi:MAG: hypothetical protein K0R76_1233 [Alphaproteobacteria bacterium]|jgi:uncharacterized phiE125 gp8 family phage protein|nr:hypothetical protein [Alphaproteobacteria bacterium]MDF3034279.1 hypothetical protein [Alphaproteobacteria bacterium]
MLTRIQTLNILPVGISEVKAHLRLEHGHEDAYLRLLIQAATGFIEEYLGRSLLAQSWRLIWQKERPCPLQLSTTCEDICSVALPYPPLRAILGVNRLMDTGEKKRIRRHRLELNHQVPKLVFMAVLEPVEIEFETGYGNHSRDIPPLIRQAILRLVADFYENRLSEGISQPMVVGPMLDAYRVVRLP